MRLIVGGLSITHHGHDVWERHARTVVLVGIKEYAETLKPVRRAKDRALRGTLLGEPERKPIAVQVAIAVDFEFKLDLEKKRELELLLHSNKNWSQNAHPHLPVGCRQRHAREDPSLLRRSVGCEADISCTHTSQSNIALSVTCAVFSLISPNHCIPSEVEPAALEIRIEVWLSHVSTKVFWDAFGKQVSVLSKADKIPLDI